MLKIRFARVLKGLLSIYFLFLLLFFAGCGLVSILGTPGRHERKIDAEYNLFKEFKDNSQQKLLVLVDQPVWLNTTVNLRQALSLSLIRTLSGQLKIGKESLISYEEIAAFRSGESDFSLLTPRQIGKALGADKVLYVSINNFNLEYLNQTDYLTGFLSGRAKLYSVSDSKQLWPRDQKGKFLKVGFDIEKRGKEFAVSRLAADGAHCVVRYLYDCPKPRFKIADDLSGAGWKDW